MFCKIEKYFTRICCELAVDSDIIFNIVKSIHPTWKKYKIKSLYDFSQETSAIVVLLDKNTLRKNKKPPTNKEVYEKWTYEQDIIRKASRQYISHLKDVVVIGDTDGIITEDYYLTDKIEFDTTGFVEHQPHCMVGNSKKCIIKYDDSNMKNIPRAVNLIKMWSCNYFHFVFESMSRLGEIEKFEEYRDWPLLIDAVVRKDTRNLELINLLNINDRKIIWVKNNDYIHVNELIVPPCMAWATWNIPKTVEKGYGYMIDHKAGDYLRNTILRNHHSKRKYSCVYIARGNNNRLVNEDRVVKYLESNGFEIFYPDQATFEEEIDCFSTADFIVLCGGGASTNLVYCKKSVQIFMILPFEFRCDSAEYVTCTVGINIHLKDAEIIKKGDILMHSTIRFSKEKCDEIIMEYKDMKRLSS